MKDEQVDLSRLWDVVVVGTGVGGSGVGQALAKSGLSVLFLEKGPQVDKAGELVDTMTPQERLDIGWWPQPMSQRRPGAGCDRFHVAVGCAVGGSSIHFAAALERMQATDFDPLRTRRGLLAEWPIKFAEFVPFYRAAESLYGITDVSDEVRESRLSEWDSGLLRSMRQRGYKPDCLHVALRYDDACEECIGRVCARRCKSDARVAGLDDALLQPRCQLLDRCDVQNLDADAHRIRTVRAVRLGQAIEVRARLVVLAAGALHSPQLLLRSRNSFWPDGLANRSDQVGRNLMFHTSDLYALWAPTKLDRRGRQKKALSVRDFYVHEGRRLGYVQSMGLDAERGHIAAYLKDTMRRAGLKNEFVLSLLAKLPSHMAAWVLGSATIFAGMTEDDPDPENRIILDPSEPDGASFSYTIPDELRQRANALHEQFAKAVRPWRLLRLSPTLTMNHGHPCGTVRFGNDPTTSVLDQDCRAHDLSNLYVVDASFMPRSGAINPSLTIAANALRVAAPIAERLKAMTD